MQAKLSTPMSIINRKVSVVPQQMFFASDETTSKNTFKQMTSLRANTNARLLFGKQH